jgi:hypothetical protein
MALLHQRLYGQELGYHLPLMCILSVLVRLFVVGR